MCKKTYKQITATVVLVFALAVAIVAAVNYKNSMAHVISVIRFFDVMIPILAVGALVKYLICGGCNCCCNKDQDSCTKK